MEKKCELSKIHPTKALPIRSLQCNINLALKENPAASTASQSTTSMSLPLLLSTSSTTAAAPTIAAAAAATHPHLAVVINELAHIWNSYKRHGQLAFMLYLAEENEDSTQFLTLKEAFEFSSSPLPTKAESSTIRSSISSLFSHLLLRLATGQESYSQTDKWTPVINGIYNIYIRHTNNIALSNPRKYALTHLLTPLAAQMAKDLVCAWIWQIQCMIEKVCSFFSGLKNIFFYF